MGNETYVEISTSEYKELLEKEVRLNLIIQKLEQDDFLIRKDYLFLAKGPQSEEEKEEQEEE